MEPSKTGPRCSVVWHWHRLRCAGGSREGSLRNTVGSVHRNGFAVRLDRSTRTRYFRRSVSSARYDCYSSVLHFLLEQDKRFIMRYFPCRRQDQKRLLRKHHPLGSRLTPAYR